MNIYENLKKLGLELPEPPPRGGLYTPVRQVGSMLYVSGQGPTEKGLPLYTGKLGQGITIEQGQAAACRCTLNALSVLHAYLGDLNRIAGVVKVLGFVASAPGFNSQPMVINGGSQLLIDLFGDSGWHARSAIGTNELPGDIPVEIEFIFELK
jgi:enamine deaminase RidA (YjgF/YER057c/UK114 family)